MAGTRVELKESFYYCTVCGMTAIPEKVEHFTHQWRFSSCAVNGAQNCYPITAP